jgi:hypothetical protein
MSYIQASSGGPADILDVPPSMFPRAGAARALPDGMHYEMGWDSGVPMPSGAAFDPDHEGGPSFGGRTVIGRTNYSSGPATNDRKVVYHRPQDVTDWQPADNAPGSVCFALKNPSRVGTNPSAPVKILSVMALNCAMKHDPEYRARWGAHDTADAVMLDWAEIGIQINKQTDLLRDSRAWTHEANHARVGRVDTVPNVWLAQDGPGPTVEGQLVGFVLRRYPYDGDAALQDRAWSGTQYNSARVTDPTSAHASRKRKREEEEDAAVHKLARGFDDGITPTAVLPDNFAACKLPGVNVATATPPLVLAQPVASDMPKREYYWSFDPYTCEDGASIVDPAVYTYDPLTRDIHNRFVGTWIPIGTVLHVIRGDSTRNSDTVGLARDALYPLTRTNDYLTAYASLDTIELQLRIRTSMSGA